MADNQHHAAWVTYQDAWADISAAERKRLLTQAVTGDCTYASPVGAGTGIESLVHHIEDFQKNYPGASFKTQKFMTHHDQALAEWTLYDANQAAASTGSSYARFAEDGRIVQLVGFFAV